MIVPSELEFQDDSDDWNYVELVPAQTADGQLRYNVYPLQEKVTGYNDTGEEIPETVRAPRAPDRMQYPVVTPTPLRSVSPSADPGAVTETP